MLVRHLVVGVVVGALAALGSDVIGLSLWATVGIYVLAANLGLGLSAALALVPWPGQAARSTTAVRQASRAATSSPLAQ